MQSLKQTVCPFMIVLFIAATAGSASAAQGAKGLDAYVHAYASMGKAAAALFADEKTRANAQANWVSTCAEAQAKMINARAAWITAVANANATNAKTEQTLEQVRTLKLDNALKVATTFYEKRKLHDTYQGLNTRKRPTNEDLIRYSKMSLPQRPADCQFEPVKGKIYWPEVLQQEKFYEFRLQLDYLFAERADAVGTAASDIHGQVQEVASQMRGQLRSKIREMDPTEYLAARKFIDSLAFEARFRARIEGVATN